LVAIRISLFGRNFAVIFVLAIVIVPDLFIRLAWCKRIGGLLTVRVPEAP
jgi:hypothetical protein